MKKLLSNPRFVTALAIAAVIFCTWSIRDQMGAGRPPVPRPVAPAMAPPPAAADEAGPEAGAPEADAPAMPVAATLDAMVFPENLPDPFAPRETTIVAGDSAAEPVEARPDEIETIALSAVWTQDAARLALVNDRILRPGDVIGRMTIDDVSVDGIWVSHWKGRDYVPFGGSFSLATPAAGATSTALARHEN